MEVTMFASTATHTEEPTHGEDDHPYKARYGTVLKRSAGRMREQDREGLPGGCGIPRTWKSSLLGQGSLQVSRARACEEIGSNMSECCLAREDIRAIRKMPPQKAVCKVSKLNNCITLYPATGNLTKQCMVLHPSVGSFKKHGVM